MVKKFGGLAYKTIIWAKSKFGCLSTTFIANIFAEIKLAVPNRVAKLPIFNFTLNFPVIQV